MAEIAETADKKEIYIVLTRTGTWVSKLIRIFTGAEFNHASISLSKDLKRMYSFGRRHPYNPIWAGLIRECPNEGTFKRFPETTAAVLKVDVCSETYNNIAAHIERMMSEQNKYHFNYLGLGYAALKRPRKKKYCYYCSEFVSEVLTVNNVEGAEKLPEVVHPINFLDLQYEQIYKGLLCEYNSFFGSLGA